MSVLRNLNILSQMRLDVPHIRLLESGVAGDFDTVVGRMTSGGKPLVVKGFTIAGSVGALASTLQLAVADSSAMNLNASESGSFLWIPTDRANEVLDGAVNEKVTGSFVSGSTNYVGIDFVRQPDETTTDLVKFKDPSGGDDTSRQVPLGQTLDYRIVISAVPFSAQLNLVPLAKIAVDSAGAVTSITDARRLMFRLGSGGDIPAPLSSFGWPQGRSEGAFSGGDKSLNNQKDWIDAVMSRIWEIGGGQNWYSPASDRNVVYTNYGTPASNGEYFTFNSGTNAVTWQGIRFLFDGGTGLIVPTKNEVEISSGTILDGQCLYVDLDRTQNRIAGVNGLTMQIGDLANIGTGPRPGSRWIVAWRIGTALYTRDWRYPVGTLFTPATNLAQGVVRLNRASPTPLDPVVVSIGTGGGAVVSATSGNTNGLEGHGFGNGAGVLGEGLGTGPGVVGFGTGNGVEGDGALYGLVGTGDSGGVKGQANTGTNKNGVDGIADGAGSGVKGTGTIGVQGVGAAVASVGVKGTGGGGVLGAGVVGLGDAGGVAGTGVSGTGYGANAGVLGVSTGTGAGVQGEAGASTGTGVYGGGFRGVQGVATFAGGTGVSGTGGGSSGIGVQGDGGAGGGTGVMGIGNASGGVGVAGVGKGTYAAVVGAVAGTGRAFEGTGGNIGLENTQLFEFTALKTGVTIIPAPEFTNMSGLASLESAAGFPVISWHSTGPFGLVAGRTCRLAAPIRIPRGATITVIEAYVKNTDTVNPYSAIGTIVSRNLYNGSTVSVASVLTTSVNIPASQDGWMSLGTPSAQQAPMGVAGANNSGFFNVDLDFAMPTSSTVSIYFGALRITYTYTAVDFMV